MQLDMSCLGMRLSAQLLLTSPPERVYARVGAKDFAPAGNFPHPRSL